MVYISLLIFYPLLNPTNRELPLFCKNVMTVCYECSKLGLTACCCAYNSGVTASSSTGTVMKKEIKKLESRQDVLSRWVEKGGMIDGQVIEQISGAIDDKVGLLFTSGIERRKSIYEILYSPESNFFEVMFGGDKRMPPCGMSKTYQEIVVFRGLYWEYMKCSCAISSNPLTYLLDNLNETTR